VVQECPREAIARPRLVVVDEALRHVGTPKAFEVHGQERHIGTDVAVAEPVGEFDAVEDAHAVIEAEDVFGLEVTVAVTDVPRGDAVAEQPGVSPQPADGQGPDLPVRRGV
jgi:hypothetical protein